MTVDETEDDVMVTMNYLVRQGLIEETGETDEFFNGNSRSYRIGNRFNKKEQKVKTEENVAMQQYGGTCGARCQHRDRVR